MNPMANLNYFSLFILFITNNNLLSIIQTYLFITYCLFVDIYKKYVSMSICCYYYATTILLQNLQV